MIKPDISIGGMAKRLSRARDTVCAKAILASWQQQEKDMCNKIPKMINYLAEETGRMIWNDGYKPLKAHIEIEGTDYGTAQGVGVFADVTESKTYAQRLAPIVFLFDKTHRELQEVKLKWWYKLFTFFKKENNDA